MRFYTLLTLLLAAISMAACGGDETAETPTAEVLAQPATIQSSYPSPADEVGYPGPTDASGYPDPAASSGSAVTEPGSAIPMIPLGEARFPGKVAFHSEQAGAGLQVYVFDGLDGSVTPLTGGVTQAYEPSWNQDCRSLIYTQQVGGTSVDLFTTSIDTYEALPFFGSTTEELLEWMPVWSPQGDRVVYQANPGGRIDICFADASGAALECLGGQGYDNADPVFSPDGKEILFASNRDGDWEIYSATVDGEGELRQLTNNNHSDLNPAFSPDGRFIVFESDATATYDIYRMKADGSDITRLTGLLENEREPEYIASNLIVFSSNEDGDYDLYLMDADGEDIRQITDYKGKDGGAVWCLSE